MKLVSKYRGSQGFGAFTIAETLTTVAILGILSGMAVAGYGTGGVGPLSRERLGAAGAERAYSCP